MCLFWTNLRFSNEIIKIYLHLNVWMPYFISYYNPIRHTIRTSTATCLLVCRILYQKNEKFYWVLVYPFFDIFQFSIVPVNTKKIFLLKSI